MIENASAVVGSAASGVQDTPPSMLFVGRMKSPPVL
jgi:hypothetical protein